MTARHVVITDVGPRDGLQNQQKILTVEQRIELGRGDRCRWRTSNRSR